MQIIVFISILFTTATFAQVGITPTNVSNSGNDCEFSGTINAALPTSVSLFADPCTCTVGTLPGGNPTLNWYDAPAGGNLIATGNPANSGNLGPGIYTFYAECACTGGQSVRVATSFEIDAYPVPEFDCPTLVCTGGIGLYDLNPIDLNAASAINGGPTATWSGSASSFVTANNQLDVSQMQTGFYDLEYTLTSVNGECINTASCFFFLDPPPPGPKVNSLSVCPGATTAELVVGSCGPCGGIPNLKTNAASLVGETWYPEDPNNPGNPDYNNPVGSGLSFDPIVSGIVDPNIPGVYNFYVTCFCSGGPIIFPDKAETVNSLMNGCESEPSLATLTVYPEMQIDVTVKSCEPFIDDEIYGGFDPDDDLVIVDITITALGGPWPEDGRVIVEDIDELFIGGTTFGNVDAGDQVIVFTDIELIGDGQQIYNFGAFFENFEVRCLPQIEQFGPFGHCSCVDYACPGNTMHEARPSSGINPALTTVYVLMDIFGTTITQVSPTGIFDVSSLLPGNGYPYYAINYDPTTGVMAPTPGGTLIPYTNPTDPCHDVDVSFPCHIAVTEDFEIEGAEDECTNINELIIEYVTGGFDPDEYDLATNSTPNGNSPYSIFLFNDGESFENGDTPIQGPIEVAGGNYPYYFLNIIVDQPTPFSVAIEDGIGCTFYQTYVVHPDNNPSLIDDFTLCLSSDPSNPTADLDLTTLLESVVPPTVNQPGTFSGVAGIINQPDLVTPANSVHSIPGSILDGLLTNPGQTTIDIEYTMGTEYPLPSGIPFCPVESSIEITLSRPDLPIGTGFTMCEGDLISANEGITSNCGGQTNWYDQNGTTFLAQTAPGVPFLPISAQTLNAGVYSYYFECVDGNNCISQRIPVQLVVVAGPPAPGVIDLYACQDETGPIEILPTSTLPAPNLHNIYQVGNTTTPINPTYQNGFDLQTPMFTSYFDATVPGVYTFDVTEVIEIVNNPPNSKYCESPAAQVNITIFPRPDINIGAPNPICEGEDLVLTADDVTQNNGLPGYTLVNPTYEWIVDIDGNNMVSAADISIGSTTANTFTHLASNFSNIHTYYVIVSYEYEDMSGVIRGVCSSDPSNFISITIIDVELPTVTGAEMCEGDNTPTLMAMGSATVITNLNWYANPTPTMGEAILATGTSYTPPTPAGGFLASNSPYTYYVENQDPGGVCVSDRVAVDLIVFETPAAPMVANQQICIGGTADNIIPLGQLGSTFTITGPTTSVGPQATFTNADLVTAGLNPAVVDIYNFSITETLTNQGNCTGDPGAFSIEVQDNIIPAPTNDGPVCVGDDITLTTPTVQGATYEWRDGTNTLVSTDQNYTFTTTQTDDGTTYTMTLVSTSLCVSNMPVSTTISVISIPDATVVNEETICEGAMLAAPLEASCTMGTVYWYDAPTAGNVINQGDQYTVPGVATLLANTYTYYITCVDPSTTCESSNRTPITLTILENPDVPTVTNSGICIGGMVSQVVPVGSSPTSMFTLTGNGAPIGPQQTFMNSDLITAGLNNMMAGTYSYTIREVAGDCISDPATLTITVNPDPSAVAGTTPNPICIGDVKQLTADIAGPNANYDWYYAGADNTIGGADDVFESNDQNPTVSPITTSSYYVIITSAEGCTSTSNVLTVTVNAPADPIIVTNNLEICEGENVSSAFEANCNSLTVNWYSAASAGLLLGSGTTFTPAGTSVLAAGTYDYFAECQDSQGCISMNRTTFTLVVNETPPAPTAANQEICIGGMAAMVIPAGTSQTSNFTITGLSGSVGPQPSFDNADLVMAGLNVNTAGSYQFNVVEVIGTCVGPPAIFSVTVNPDPSAVAGVDPTPICEGQSKLLTADFAGANATYDWFYAGGDNTIGGTDDILESNNQNPTVTPAMTSSYYVIVTSSSGCVATSNLVTVTINTPTIATVVTNNLEICERELLATPFEAACSGSTVNWYNAPIGGALLGTGATFTPSTSNLPAAAYNYYAECQDNSGCTSPSRVVFTLTVKPSPDAPTVINQTLCAGEDAATFSPIGLTSGSTFNLIGLSSTVGPQATFTNVDLTTAGLDINTAGSYTFEVREVLNSCIGEPAILTITVTNAPPAIAGTDATPICVGDTKLLTADNGGNGTGYSWFYAGADNMIGGTDDVLESNLQNPNVSPITTSSYYVIVTSANNCSSTSNLVTVVVTTPTDPVVVTDNLEICEGETLSTAFEASCNGASINWYTTASAGVLLGTGPTFIPTNTSNLAAGNYVYFAECQDIQGCTSNNRLEFNLTVNPSPVAPTVDNEQICENEMAPSIVPTGTTTTSVFSITYPDGTEVGAAAATFTIANTNGFDNTTAGTYDFSVREVTGSSCTGLPTIFTITVNPTPPAVAGVDATPICMGDSKLLTADNAGMGAAYDWYYAGADNMIGGTDDILESNDQNPSVSPSVTSSYYVIVTSVNGCVATSNLVTVTLTTPADPLTITDNVEICEGETLTTPLEANCGSTTVNWYSAASGGVLLGTGSTFIPANTSNLAAGTYSYFTECEDAQGCTSINRLEFTLIVNPEPQAPTVDSEALCVGETVPSIVPTGTSTASVFTITYPDGTEVGPPSAAFTITNTNGFDNTVAGMYDFSVREVTGSLCIGAPTIFTITVDPAPPAIAGVDATPICNGQTKLLTTDNAGMGATYTWYYAGADNMIGGTDDVLASNDQNPNVGPSITSSYYVIVTTGSGCMATSNLVTVIVNAPADPLKTEDNVEICEGETQTTALEAFCGANTVNWYTAPSAGTLVGVGATFIPTNTSNLAAGTYNYYAECVDAQGCISVNRVEFTLIVNPGPAAPIVDNEGLCVNGSVPLIAPTGTTTTSVFSITYPDGTEVGAAAATFTITNTNGFDNSVAGTYDFSVREVTVSGCIGLPAIFMITVDPTPPAVAGADATPICNGQTKLLTADNGGMGATYDWYYAGADNMIGGTDDVLESTDQNPNVGPSITSSYYVIVTTASGCTATSNLVSVTVNAPADPTTVIDNLEICEGETLAAALEADCGSTTVNWYSAASGGTLLGTGTTFIPTNTSNLAAGTYSYFAECEDAQGCMSVNRLEFTLIVNPGPGAPIVDNEGLCVDATVPLIAPTGTTTTSIFSITYPDGTEVGTTAATFTITNTNGFDNAIAGVYDFSVREVTGSGCIGAPAIFTITVDPIPPAIAGVDATPICNGQTKLLTADNAGMGAVYTWYFAGVDNMIGGTDDVLESNDQNPNIGPSITSSYYVIVTSASGCTATSNLVSITVNAPANPITVTDNLEICEGETLATALEADCGSTTVNWYSAASGGTLLGTGTTFIPTNTSNLAAGTYSYFAECEDAQGCMSVTRLEFILIVNPGPAAPIVGNEGLCVGESVPLITPTGTTTTSVFSITYPDGTEVGTAAATFTITNTNGFDNMLAGVYDFSVREVTGSGCIGLPTIFTITVDPTPPAVAGVDATPICNGQTKLLTADNGGMGATYDWYYAGADNMIGGTDDVLESTDQNPNVGPIITSSYYVIVTTASGCTATSNLVSVTVNAPADPTTVTDNLEICEGETLAAALEADCGLTTVNWYSAASGGTLLGTGTTFIPTNTSNLAAGTYSYFAECEDAQGCISITRLEFVLIVNPGPATPIVDNEGICAGESVPLIAPTGTTTTSVFSITYPDGTEVGTAAATFTITNTNGFDNTQAGVYDFSVREVTGNGCIGLPAIFTITVDPTPPAVAGVDATPICNGQTKLLTADNGGVGATYDWYYAGADNMIGGTDDVLESTDQNPNVGPSITSSYYVIVTTASGCTATSNLVSVTVNAPADPTTVTDNLEICEGETLATALEADCGAMTVNWYSAASGGILLGTGTTFIPTNTSNLAAGTYSYFAECEDAQGCMSVARLEFTLIVNPEPGVPTVGNEELCIGDVVPKIVPLGSTTTSNFTITYPDGTEVGPIASIFTIANTNGFDATIAGVYNFSVIEVTNNSCVGQSSPFTITVNGTPSAVAGVSPTPICSGQSQQLNADNAGVGAVYDWYYAGSDGAIGGGDDVLESTDQNPVVMPVVTSTYYFIVTSASGCIATSNLVTVTLNIIADAASVTNNLEICSGETLTTPFEADCGAASVNWYDSASGGVLLSTGATFIPINTSSLAAGTYNFFAECEDVLGCTSSNRLAFILTVYPVPGAPAVVNETICLGGTPTLVTPTGSTGASVFNIYGPSSLTPLQTNQSAFDLTDVEFATDFDNTAAGVYQFSISEVSTDGCEGAPANYAVTVSDKPMLPAPNNDGPICIGNDVQLTTGTITNATYSWYDDVPDYTDLSLNLISTQQNPMLSNATIATEGTYYVIVNVNGCLSDPGSTFVDIIELVEPANPVGQSICEGQSLVDPLEVDPCSAGGMVTWWDAPSGGNQVGTGETYFPNNTITLTQGTYTYYAQCIDVNGCTSLRIPVDLEVTPKPDTPTISTNAPICEGEDLILTTSDVPGATYQWVGPLGGSASTLMDPLLTTTTSSTTITDTDVPYLPGDWSVQVVINGCVSELSPPVTVTINPIPVATATNNGPICPGEEVQLFAGNVPGATYEWTEAGSTVIVSTEQNPIIFNLQSDQSYELIVNLNGCPSPVAQTSVTVNALPIALPLAAYSLNMDCSPADLTLTANATGSAPLSYEWIGPNSFVSNAENPVIPNAVPANNGSYTLIVTDVNGCQTTEVTNVISDIPNPVAQPVIASTGPTCEGETIVLTVPVYSGSSVTYTWNTPSLVNVTGENTNEITISPVDSTMHEGAYSITVVVDGCELTSSVYDLDVYVLPEVFPIATTTDICEGGTLELFANSVNGVTYSWTGPNGFTSNAENPVISNVTVANNGGYTLVVTSVSGCPVSESVTVSNIISTPVTPSITTNSPVCIDENISLNIQQVYVGAAINYSWINGAGTIIGVGSSLTIAANDVDAISPYSVQVTVDGCVSDVSAPANVIVNPLPNATASNNGPICEGDAVQLFAGNVPGASYEWRESGSPTIISTTQNPTIFNVSTNTTYELTVVSNGCTSDPLTTTTVTINPLPIISNISGAGTYCEGESVTLSADNLVTTGMTNVTYTWTGPGGFSFTSTTVAAGPFDVVINNLNASDAGTYSLVLESDDGCISVGSTVIIAIDPAPATPTITSNGPLCAGDVLQLSTTPYSGTTVVYEWFFNGSSVGTTPIPNFTAPGVTTADAGTYTMQVSVEGCVSLTSNSVLLMVGDPQMPAPTAIDTTVCAGETVSLSSGILADGYQWTGPGGFSSTVANPIITNTTSFSGGTYSLVITEDGCDSPAGTIDIFVTAVPTTPTVDNSSPSCAGSNVILEVTSGFGGPSAVYQWFESGSNAPLGPPSTSSDFTLQNITVAEQGGYFVIVTDNGCSSLPSNDTQIVINNNPGDAADAGTDITICGGNTTNLEASVPIGTGIWSTNSPGVSVIAPTDPQSLVTGLSEGTHVFTWTISNGTCINYDSDDVTVIVTDVAADVAFAGLNQEWCDTTATALEGATNFTDPDVVGVWSQSSVQINTGVVIVDPTNPNTEITGLYNNDGTGSGSVTFTFTWTLSNGVCGEFDSDEVLVTIYDNPLDVAYAGEDITLCGDMIVLEADPFTVGTGLWISPTPGVNIVSPEEPTTIVDNLAIGENVFVWILSNGACADYSSDAVLITYEEPVSSSELSLMDDIVFVEFNTIKDTLPIFDNDLMDPDLQEANAELLDGGDHGKVRIDDDGAFSYTPDNNYLGNDSFLYSVCATNSCGTYCDTATVEIKIGVEGTDCYIPNIITPGVDGHNDEFIIPCLINYPNNKLMVFNRWGDKVFESAPYNNDWKGTYNNEDLPQGTYYYILIPDREINDRQAGFLSIHR